MGNSIQIIGIGNDFRADDSIGLQVARVLAETCMGRVRIEETSGDSARLLDLWSASKTTVVVDAVVSGQPPGTIHWFRAGDAPLPVPLHAHSTHAQGLEGALRLGSLLGRLPDTLVICGIEIADTTVGSPMTPAVASAIPLAVARIRDWIAAQPQPGENNSSSRGVTASRE